MIIVTLTNIEPILTMSCYIDFNIQLEHVMNRN